MPIMYLFECQLSQVVVDRYIYKGQVYERHVHLVTCTETCALSRFLCNFTFYTFEKALRHVFFFPFPWLWSTCSTYRNYHIPNNTDFIFKVIVHSASVEMCTFHFPRTLRNLTFRSCMYYQREDSNSSSPYTAELKWTDNIYPPSESS